MNLPMPFAVSFPCWTCRHCGQVVEWVDALVVDTPEVFQVLHKDCADG